MNPTVFIADGSQNLRERVLNCSEGYLLDPLNGIEWFTQFISRLDIKYEMERFAIWMAIFIIARECNHEQVQSISAEMFEQTFHQETNSGIAEDMLQLRQLGSITLSYYKRFSDAPMFKNMHTGLGEAAIEDEDDDLMGTVSKDDNLHSILRRILDTELLKGEECEVCRHQPSEVLEPLKWSCPNGCRYGRKGVLIDLYCSISFRRVEIVPFSALARLQPQIKRIILLSSSEWARKFVLQIRDKQSDQIDPRDNLVVEERIDISSKFQRLTMLRRRSGPGNDNEQDDSDSDDDSSIESTGVARSEEQSVSASDLQIFNQFIKSSERRRTGIIHGALDQELSESVKVIRFLTEDSNVGTVPLCLDELYVGDSIHSCSVIALYVHVRRSLWSHGKIWHCHRRSQVSNLMIGCGRYYQSVELTLTGNGSMSGSNYASQVKCPNCGQDLDVLTRLSEVLD